MDGNMSDQLKSLYVSQVPNATNPPMRSITIPTTTKRVLICHRAVVSAYEPESYDRLLVRHL